MKNIQNFWESPSKRFSGSASFASKSAPQMR